MKRKRVIVRATLAQIAKYNPDRERNSASWDALHKYMESARRSVVPLYGLVAVDAVPRHLGSGVVVSIGDRVLILTAAHVAKNLNEPQYLFFAAKAENGPLAVVQGDVMVTVEAPSHHGGGDPFDACTVLLGPGPNADRLRELAVPFGEVVTLDVVDSQTELVLYGYPHRQAERRVAPKRIAVKAHWWRGRALAPEKLERIGLEKPLHIALPMPDTVRNKDGALQKGRSPNGCSGSGMWIVGPGRPPRLAAIFTEYRDDCLIGTRVDAHMRQLLELDPALFAEAFPQPSPIVRPSLIVPQ